MMMMVVSVILGGFIVLLVHLYRALILKAQRVRSKLQKQGIQGPPPSFLLGNISQMKKIQHQHLQSSSPTNQFPLRHDWLSSIFPHLIKWTHQYGPVFVYSAGNIQFMCVTDIEMVKEISMRTSLDLGKPSYLSKDRGPLLGQGIITSNGAHWAHQRKIIAPEFSLDKVKGMVSLMLDSTMSILRSWESIIEKSEGGIADIRVDKDMKSLSADIISRACFGSSYAKGEDIFTKLQTLQDMMSSTTFGVPGLRHLPTKTNRSIWKLQKEIDSMILDVVKQRVAATYEKDLLQMILEGAKAYADFGGLSGSLCVDKFIVDNCKNIYFAGHETSAITLSWSLLLLAAHPEWQDRARAEVLQLCQDGLPNVDMLRHMKILTMVIQETLRLYPPAAYATREALKDIKLKDIVVPKGIVIQIPIPILQQLPEMWGADAHEFNPARFEHGILRACKIPQAYMPFGFGARICAGQQLAMTQVKISLSLLLSNFCFSISPAYTHTPAFKLVIQPLFSSCRHWHYFYRPAKFTSGIDIWPEYSKYNRSKI